jgi:hypothetical protein
MAPSPPAVEPARAVTEVLAPSEVAPSPPRRSWRGALWAGGVTTALGAVLGAIFGGLALRDQATLQVSCSADRVCAPREAGLVREYDVSRVVAWSSLALGAVGAVVMALAAWRSAP